MLDGEVEPLKELTNKLGINLNRPKHEKHLKCPDMVNKGNVLLHAYLHRVQIPDMFNKVRRRGGRGMRGKRGGFFSQRPRLKTVEMGGLMVIFISVVVCRACSACSRRATS